MQQARNINVQEENTAKIIYELIRKNYRLFILSVFLSVCIAFAINRYSIPQHNISSSILIKENQMSRSDNPSDFLYSNLFGQNQSFQNEFWIIKSYPIIEKTSRNLNLPITYYSKGRFNYYEIYQDAPFIVYFVKEHVQPLNVKFHINFANDDTFSISAESKEVTFHNFSTNKNSYRKSKWKFNKIAKLGEIIESPDLAFIIQIRDTINSQFDRGVTYCFDFKSISRITNEIRGRLNFTSVDRQATVINIRLKSESISKGIDIVNELMNVYSQQNLEQKNHLATITIDYIEQQLGEISDSLNRAEDYLQKFRSSRQLLNITDQATALSSQFMDLQNQLAELVSRKKYYDYVSDLLKNDNFTNIMLPASIGISDQLLNNLMSELITAQAQRSSLIENKQERNPLVQRLNIQIENLKKTITENISAVANTTSISVDEMTRRINKLENEISRLPATQRQLGTIERKYRLNDAIYNYLMEKHSEAKITKASNLPDNLIIEPAKMVGNGPTTPNEPRNYLVALFFGFVLPFGFLMFKNAINNKIESQDDIENITDIPLLGKIMHNRYKTNNVMFEFPKSNISESFRALRTNLDFFVKGEQKKVILVTSCFENEGKSFISMNLAMSYAQLGRRTLLVDFDLRKPKAYFKENNETQEGLSSYMINKIKIESIILKSDHNHLDYIVSGILPPNPTELIALNKTKDFFDNIKNLYDIIILDTTPLAQVTDAYLLLNYSDLNILVTRCGVTLKKVFSLIIKDLKLKKIENTCIVLNDNKLFPDQYGYGYGYYNKGQKKILKFKKRKT